MTLTRLILQLKVTAVTNVLSQGNGRNFVCFQIVCYLMCAAGLKVREVLARTRSAHAFLNFTTGKKKLFISLFFVEEEYRSNCEVRKEHIPKGAVYFYVFSKYVGITVDGQISECIYKIFSKSAQR
jgi:hypothetical protein